MKGEEDGGTNKITAKMEKLKTTLSLPTNFPEESVYNVYRNPVIEKSLQPFSWDPKPQFDRILKLDFVEANAKLKEEIQLMQKKWTKPGSSKAVSAKPSKSSSSNIKSKRLAAAIKLLKSRKT